MLELLAMGSDHNVAVEVAAALGGRAYLSSDGESERRPFSALVRVDTDNLAMLARAADIALHVAYSRDVKVADGSPPPDRVVAAFPLLHHPDLTHDQADEHWRDVHAPLALQHHSAMCDYTQLSIVTTISGRPLDGVALCAFANRDDLRERFFNDEAARAAIEADVSGFADIAHSPRRVVLTQPV